MPAVLQASGRGQVSRLKRLKKLVYRPEMLRLFRALGVTEALRRLDYRLSVREGIASFSLMGTKARFACPDWESLRQVEFDFCLETDFLDLLARFLGSGMRFWDVGAEVGLFTIPAARRVGAQGMVVAFEPEPARYARLMENVRLNGLTNVRVLRCALGDEDGLAHLGGTGAPRILGQDANGMGIEVPIANGDLMRSRERLPVPHVIKIDVEGYGTL